MLDSRFSQYLHINADYKGVTLMMARFVSVSFPSRFRAVLGCLLLSLALLAQDAREFDIPGDGGWVDTGLDVRVGDAIVFNADGTLKLPQNRTTGPGGASRGFRDLLRSYPVNQAGLGALVGRIGSNDTAAVFLVGGGKRIEANRTGRLFLGINKTGGDRLEGNFRAKIEFASRGPEVSAVPADLPLAAVTTEVVDRFPRRVVDAQGNEGDNTNFVIVGPERKIVQALANAGWVQVDRDNKSAVITAILATISKQAYLTLPMSELMLFDRVQDYGFAHAEPLAVIAERHHFRIWKAPFQVGGQELWVGAGTHDIGFERDQRNNGITHKIDPEIDKERDYIGRTLQETGMVARLSYVMPSKPNKEARTATGGTFRSDGRLLVIHMIPDNLPGATARPEVAFANLFCSVREKENPDGGRWEGCDRYLETPPQARPDLGLVSTKYRVLIVPGFFSQCASGVAPAFQEGVAHLSREHALSIDWWVPPNASSESNARSFAEFIRDRMKNDSRKFIVIGYSKGAPDVQVALAAEDGVKDAVAAFVSVAGAVGGSAIADVIPAQASGWIERFKMGKCEGDIAAAFQSLKRESRRAFLAANPNPMVPSYSLPAVSEEGNTSKALQESWKLMTAFARRQDSQIAYEDAVVPGSKVLGVARADHLAVALPFDKSSDAAVRALADRGRYPRAALLEAIVRFVAADLEGRVQ
jgi:hypothetical protein